MSQLQRALLIPFDAQGTNPVDSQQITLDFNPDTLTIKVANTLQDVPGRRGRQRTQFVGSSSSTLTFDAVFDTTRPKNLPGESPGGESPEQLDVRKRTQPIAGLLQVADPDAEHPAPTRVRFSWGSILFDGIIDTYTEVLEYFSPEGVPLRSKVSISIKEQKFEYQVDTTKRAALAGFGGGSTSAAGQSPTSALSSLGASINQAGSLAAQNGLDSLLDIGVSGGLSFNASLSLDVSAGFSAGVSISGGLDVGLDLGVGVDLGFSAGAALDVSASAAIEVFGGAAVHAAVGGGVDLSASARGEARPGIVPPASAAPTPTAWAPDGPVAGSRAAGLASVVNEQRAFGAWPEAASPSGGTFTATDLPSAAPEKPLPIKGSPPLVPARFGPAPVGGVMVKARFQPASHQSLTGDRPRWEDVSRAPSAGPTGGARAPCCGAPRSSSGAAQRGGCGCGSRRTSW